MSLITRIDHINVQVPPEKEDEAKRFYGELLGLKPLKKPDSLGPAGQHYCLLENPHYELHLGVARNAEGQSNKAMRNHLGFQVDDLATARKRFEAAGVRIEEAEPAYSRSAGSTRIASSSSIQAATGSKSSNRAVPTTARSTRSR